MIGHSSFFVVTGYELKKRHSIAGSAGPRHCIVTDAGDPPNLLTSGRNGLFLRIQNDCIVRLTLHIV